MDDNNPTPAASCADEFDPKALLVHQALDLILSRMTPISDTENCHISQALNRVVARPVSSSIDIPPYTNSAMDGYAVRAGDLPKSGKKSFKLVDTVMAGAPSQHALEKNQCIRIMTGGKMPEGSDTVIMQEHVLASGDTIEISTGHQAGQNVRQAGEDVITGQTVLDTGKRITAADTGLLASLGIQNIEVIRKLKVAFFSTGDELVGLGKPLSEGQIYDSNRYTLNALLSRIDAEILDMGVIRDDRTSIETAFREATATADVLITTGGVSVGDADYVKDTLEKLGQVSFWKIAMKPGRPLAFGNIEQCAFFGLPGNPVSTLVTFVQFVLPGLRRLQNENPHEPLQFKLRCMEALRKKPGRLEYQRGIIEKSKTGEFVVRPVTGQGSHMVGSMSQANCFIVLPVESEGEVKDTFVDVQPFHGLLP